MTKVSMVLLVACALAATACDDKKTEAKPGQTSAASGAAKQAPAPAKSAAPAGGW